MTDDEVAVEYRRRFESHLQEIASRLQVLIEDHLDGTPFVERVVARAKDPGRFAAKATKLDEAGDRRYTSPLTEIQDQVGARVIVLYPAGVDLVSNTLHRYLRPVEDRELVPESAWAFGYFGRHHVYPLPNDVVPDTVPANEQPQYFELQVKTLFQHAWSEAEHDLGYKPIRTLTLDEERRLAFAAAQAWGADEAFNALQQELRPETEA